MAKIKSSAVLERVCEFGGVSFGDQVVRIGVRFDRNLLTIQDADDVLVGHRLNGVIALCRGTDDQNQMTLNDDEFLTQVKGVFDCKRIGVNTKHITASFGFSVEDVNAGIISKFAKGGGRVRIDAVYNLPEEIDHRAPASAGV
jgi:hypothetical protein